MRGWVVYEERLFERVQGRTFGPPYFGTFANSFSLFAIVSWPVALSGASVCLCWAVGCKQGRVDTPVDFFHFLVVVFLINYFIGVGR